MRARYIQVDLEIDADFDLQGFVRLLGDSVVVLWCGPENDRFLARLELNAANMTLNKTLRRFCEIIEALPPAALDLWKKSKRRVFDIGFDSGDKRPAMKAVIEPRLLSRIAALDATVAITIYPLET